MSRSSKSLQLLTSLIGFANAVNNSVSKDDNKIVEKKREEMINPSNRSEEFVKLYGTTKSYKEINKSINDEISVTFDLVRSIASELIDTEPSDIRKNELVKKLADVLEHLNKLSSLQLQQFCLLN